MTRAKINHMIELPDSSFIEAVGYDPETAVLDVEIDGKRYRHYYVGAHTYARLMNEKSAGEYYNREIKPHHRARRITPRSAK